ncbi:hypothetical protein ACVGX7_00300, partial [Enterobacter hormaechei]
CPLVTMVHAKSTRQVRPGSLVWLVTMAAARNVVGLAVSTECRTVNPVLGVEAVLKLLQG